MEINIAMPFTPGNKLAKGGARKGSGRKPKTTEEELRSLLDEAWPDAEKASSVKAQAKLAARGDLNALRFLMAYRFGTPRSGDELKTEEAVENAVDNLLTTIEEGVASQTWREVQVALGFERDAVSARDLDGGAEGES